MTLSNHFKQSTGNSPLLSTFILVNDDDAVILETRDERKMRKELKVRKLQAPSEMSNRLQQWAVNLNPLIPMKYTKANPRFVWNIGAIAEQFPDMPERGKTVDLIDRKHGKVVLSVAPEYAQLMVLETIPNGAPFTALEDWLNGLDKRTLASEGLPV